MQEKIKCRTGVAAAVALLAGVLAAGAVQAQNFPIAPTQRATAEQVAQAGVPLSELAPNAPDSYTVKRGDTLWAISGIFLRNAWRWPELWGMNMQDIPNPHLIFPGQQLYLERLNGRARLRTSVAATGSPPTQTIRVSPRTRYETLADAAIPTLKSHLIEPFLAEPIVVDEATLSKAPRIVATQEERVLITPGNRAYARGDVSAPLSDAIGKPLDYRIFRDATPLKDPISGEILGYEAQYVGKASLARSESTAESKDKDGKARTDLIPATIDIVSAKEEIRVGDRLLPEPPRQFQSYTPRAPLQLLDGARIMSIYGSSVVANAAQSQVVAINRGTRDGVESGHVLAILSDGGRVVDKTDPSKPTIKLPDERNGLVMVFRPFEKVSYALILEIKTSVKVGDRLVNPR